MKTKSTFRNCFFAILILGIIIGVPYVTTYNHEKIQTITIYSINTKLHVSGSDGDTYSTYEYLVSTDKGIFKIEPDGFFHSDMFGKLEEGKTYTVKTRGFSVPLLGIYPNIMEEIK